MLLPWCLLTSLAAAAVLHVEQHVKEEAPHDVEEALSSLLDDKGILCFQGPTWLLARVQRSFQLAAFGNLFQVGNLLFNKACATSGYANFTSRDDCYGKASEPITVTNWFRFNHGEDH